MHQDIATILGNWDAANVKLQRLDSEVENVGAQIQAMSQELTTQLTNHRTLLMKQSGQVEKVETMLGEIQTT